MKADKFFEIVAYVFMFISAGLVIYILYTKDRENKPAYRCIAGTTWKLDAYNHLYSLDKDTQKCTDEFEIKKGDKK